MKGDTIMISKMKTGHTYYNSAFETSDTCATCNGARCDSCKDVWELTTVLDTKIFYSFEEAKAVEDKTLALVTYYGHPVHDVTAYTITDGVLMAKVYIYKTDDRSYNRLPDDAATGYMWLPCNKDAETYNSVFSSVSARMNDWTSCTCTDKACAYNGNSCDVSKTCTDSSCYREMKAGTRKERKWYM